MSLDWMRGPLRLLARGRMARDRLRATHARGRVATDPRGHRRRPAAEVGLVRHHGWNPFHLTKDHQVLAYGYETEGPSGPTTIRLYDPNWPNRDDVSLRLLQRRFPQSTGEPLFGVLDLG